MLAMAIQLSTVFSNDFVTAVINSKLDKNLGGKLGGPRYLVSISQLKRRFEAAEKIL